MRRELRERVRASFGARRAYCGVSENSTGSSLTVDHFRPRSQGGTDDEENLVSCCHGCNEFKSDYWPRAEELRLINPRTDDMSLFLREGEDGVLVPLHPRGETHIERLHLNRPPAVARRLQEKRYVLLQSELEEARARLEEAEWRAHQITAALEAKRQN